MSTHVKESMEHFPLSAVIVITVQMCIIFECIAVRLITVGQLVLKYSEDKFSDYAK